MQTRPHWFYVPLMLLVVSVPLTCWLVWLQVWAFTSAYVYAQAAWCMFLFCYAHRLVYFYHVRQAPRWVYVVAMPWVLLMYPALFVCLLLVVAMEQVA